MLITKKTRICSCSYTSYSNCIQTILPLFLYCLTLNVICAANSTASLSASLDDESPKMHNSNTTCLSRANLTPKPSYYLLTCNLNSILFSVLNCQWSFGLMFKKQVSRVNNFHSLILQNVVVIYFTTRSGTCFLIHLGK